MTKMGETVGAMIRNLANEMKAFRGAETPVVRPDDIDFEGRLAAKYRDLPPAKLSPAAIAGINDVGEKK